jgi:hypothetical protein
MTRKQRAPGVASPEDDSALPLANLVIAGVAKAGTTSLFRYLAQHPDVCPSAVKEPRYFLPLRYGKPLPPVSRYAEVFAHWTGERYRMEATPGYYPGGRAVARAIDDVIPGSRVVVSFRDPVQRCWSWYRFGKSGARIPKELPFSAYLDRCLELHRAGVDLLLENQPFWGLGGGCYDAWIDDWLEVFGRRMRIEFFELLIADPREVTEQLCRWLDLDPTPCAAIRYDVENRTVQYKNRRLQELALQLNRGGERYFARHPRLKRTLRGAYYRMNGDNGDERLDPASRERLTAFYAPHNKRLATSLAAAGLDRWPAWLAPPGSVR